jgi:histidyl-tRNA synthetase
MQYADSIGAKYVLVIGDSELESNVAEIKEMQSGNKIKMPFSEIKTFLKQ